MRFTSISQNYVPGAAGPTIKLDVPRLSQDEADKVSDYLLGGLIVLGVRHFVPDKISGEPRRVPINSRTDGEWIWQDSLLYYVKNYCLSPDEDFLAYVRELNYLQAHVVTEGEVREALAFLLPAAPVASSPDDVPSE